MPFSIPPPARTVLWIILGISAVLLAISYLHDPERQPAPPPEPGSVRIKADGIVTGFGSNPAGDIDKISLAIKNDSVWFHFPPHTARGICDLVQAGSRATIEYETHPTRRGTTENRLLSIESGENGRMVRTDGIPPPPPRPGESITVSGRAGDLIFSPDSQARFFVLSGKRIVLSPRSAQSLLPLLRQGNAITVKGDIRSETDGFASQGNLPMVHARTLQIDSINYLVE